MMRVWIFTPLDLTASVTTLLKKVLYPPGRDVLLYMLQFVKLVE